jgi:hypothetical protein
MGDIRGGTAPLPIFPETKFLYVKKCDKNFTYFHVKKGTFPNLQTLFLETHPCEPTVLHRFNSKGQRLVLSKDWNSFKGLIIGRQFSPVEYLSTEDMELEWKGILKNVGGSRVTMIEEEKEDY